jgi:hypothetical protein
MDNPYPYEIRVEGRLGEQWADWFEGMTITNDPDGEVVLNGVIGDQAALFGILNKIRDLNLRLISVMRCPSGE